MKTMTTKKTDAEPQLLSYAFSSPRVTAFSTQRQGGVSSGTYAEMNINGYCGDRPEDIAVNRHLLAEKLHIEPNRLIMPHQTHKDKMRRIDPDFFNLSSEEREATLEGIDAVSTDLHDVCIGVSTADCIPILLYDPEHHAAAAVHAGWRGTVMRIVEKSIRQMTLDYGTRPELLEAVIGPGISQEAFEVGDEVYDAFREAGFPMSEIARKQERWHIDLWAANYLQLENCGLRINHIQVSGICTYRHCEEYFSARRLGIASGRIFTGIILHP